MVVDESIAATILYLGSTAVDANGTVKFQCGRSTGPRQKSTYSDDGDQELFGKH